MSNVSHVSTVDRGLKMKIKRTKVGPNSAKNDAKHELPAKGDPAGGSTSTTQHASTGGVHLVNGLPSGSTGGVTMDTKPSGSVGSAPAKVGGGSGGGGSGGSGSASAPDPSKDKSPKVKAQFTKRDKSKDKSGGGLGKPQGDNIALLSNGSTGGGSSSGVSGAAGVNLAGSGLSGGVGNGLDHYPQITMEPRVAVEAVSVKRDVLRPVLDDPYEFNAKVEDGFGLPPKKLKTETKVRWTNAAIVCSTVGILTLELKNSSSVFRK